MWTKGPVKATSKRMGQTVAVMALAALLAGCANGKMTTGSVGGGKKFDQMNSQELASASTNLGRAYARKPSDMGIAMKYATALQAEGKNDQSLAVMRRLAIAYPNDRNVLSAYGKALAANGEFEAALEAVRKAQRPEYPDWRLLSAEGAILDQVGQKDQARAIYRKALDIKPNEPSVLSNLGMSYILEGDLKTAETHLSTAVRQPGADSRVRQNLALVVGLQGRFEEAERIAGAELSPQQAQANVAYLRSMLAQQNAWSQLENDDKQKQQQASN